MTAIGEMFTFNAAVAFLVFTLLYTPCVAAIAAVKRELKSGKWALIIAFGQTAFAWVISFIVYQLLNLIL